MLIAFNKPSGVLCQFSPSDGLPVLADFIAVPGVYPAGRLDKDSEGLLLLTNDGSLQNQIASPDHKLPKTYHVQVEGAATTQSLRQLRSGVLLKDGMTSPADVELLAKKPGYVWKRTPPVQPRAGKPTTWLAVTLREGKNRQVRRMTAHVNLPTLRLIRYAIGSLSVEGLSPGQWLEIDARSVGLA